MWKTFSRMFVGVLMVAGCVCAATGCKKSPTDKPAGNSAEIKSDNAQLANVHWLGTKRIAADTNAAQLVRLWNLPESRRLLSQTLDKLALAPWRADIKGVDWDSITNYAPLVSADNRAKLLRPLMEDVIANEGHIRVEKAAGEPVQFGVAIRLEPARAEIWTTNFDMLRQTKGSVLTGARLSREGEWTVVASEKAGEKLVGALKAAITAPAKPSWVSSTLNLRNLAQALKLDSPALSNLAEADLSILGVPSAVRTSGELRFAKAPEIPLGAWRIPTNIINDPLIGFSAARGIQQWLGSAEFWKDQKLGTPPDQMFFWAQRGAPWFHFFAVPSAEAEAQVRRIRELVTERVNPVLASNKLGTMISATNANRIGWKGIPLFAPNVGVESTDGGSFITGGFYALGLSNAPMPGELLTQLYSGTNIVWYDWELTRFSLEGWMGISQLLKHALGYPRLTHTVGFDWLIAAHTNLANCTTLVKVQDPAVLTFTRESTIGLNSAELFLLVEWLESPDFPSGLHVLREKRPSPFIKKGGVFSDMIGATSSSSNDPAKAHAPATSGSAPKKNE